ncbi:SRPBCC family protein [Tateyamaria sp. SN6-1]|uniref:SRPBCC family protein n=1 Tax=Tateyamaria sp. SN6-1 TaxID=3092148 RepID=UPI0039F5ABC6
MAYVESSQIIKAPVEDVFAAWNDFGNIDRFNPAIVRSELLDGSTQSGQGAARQCTLSDGKNYIREKVIECVPNQRLVIDIYEGTVPLKSAKGTLTFKSLGSEKTEVTMRLEFTPKFGLLGKLMIPMMKPQFGKNVRDMLAGNAAYVERGEVVVRA